jgi:hypothetical protein
MKNSAVDNTNNKRKLTNGGGLIQLEETTTLWRDLLYPDQRAKAYRRTFLTRCFSTNFRSQEGLSTNVLSRGVPFAFHWTEQVRDGLKVAIETFDNTIKRPE